MNRRCAVLLWKSPLLAIIALLGSARQPLAGQVSSGASSIEGVVNDPSGAAVANAQVEVKNVNTGVSRSAVTDPGGRYVFLSLPVGEYEVRANASGFRTTVRSGVTLAIGRTPWWTSSWRLVSSAKPSR